MDLWVLTLFIFAGVAGGLLLGLIGVGMALVTVPFLTFMLPSLGFSAEVTPVIALGSSMLIAAIGSVSSLRVHQQKGAINWGLIRLMLPASLFGVVAGSLLVTRLPALWLQCIFAAFLLYVAFSMLKPASLKTAQLQQPPSNQLLRWFPSVVGATGSFIGAGGGVLMVPFLGRFMAMPKAVASSVAVGFPVTVFGTISYMLQTAPVNHPDLIGAVYWPAVLGMSIGSVVAAPLGVQLATKVPAALLKKIFACVLLLIALKMLLSF
ncbi:MAG: sulfite exporter TauE/SafE family protein [Gammaproteobacteria bacterium]|nr:sulfite exporter TauE/SafE family protein [Gammaproteobacteria bacterium]MBU2057631.1 sulfite exporter TauE/SafE family protein [Gammaproteobacteria bacterium]MBU2175611.1 sulfite exporter TauE/SafE family protein [Gammaproteobacteria bacterium]MBU2246013.1 sulfite exporter TauE/SafE family protein [Gammaproteobacteria bacterium]MBU2394677.1 sulfite exporter TauE/SafE family protein [Gammaproteobacteria bacterium]